MTRLKGALIGFGLIGERGHAPAYLARARTHGDVGIVAVADCCAARREAARAVFPGAKIHEDAASLLADPTLCLDFADVATPPASHAVLAHMAIDRGLHVLCEKPLATTSRAAHGLVAHALRARRVLHPCHDYKHAPVVKSVNAVLAAGTLGQVHLVTIQTFRSTHAKGTAAWRPDWRRERRHAGGGIGMDHGPLVLDLASDWLRSRPTSISAITSSAAGADTEDEFSCTVTFPTGFAMVHLTWTSGVRKVLYTIRGDRGAVRFEDDDLEITTHDRSGEGLRIERLSLSSRWMDPSHAAWFTSLLGDFVGAVEKDDIVGHETRQAVQCVDLLGAAYASARQGSREMPLASEAEPAAAQAG